MPINEHCFVDSEEHFGQKYRALWNQSEDVLGCQRNENGVVTL